MKNHNQSGIAHLGLLLLAVLIAVVAFAGYKVATNNPKDNSTVTPPAQQTQTINSQADLGSAEGSLNSQDVDKNLDPAQFDQDVNSLY